MKNYTQKLNQTTNLNTKADQIVTELYNWSKLHDLWYFPPARMECFEGNCIRLTYTKQQRTLHLYVEEQTCWACTSQSCTENYLNCWIIFITMPKNLGFTISPAQLDCNTGTNSANDKIYNKYLSEIDDAWDLIGQANSMTLGAKEALIELGWREVKYQHGLGVSTYLIHKSLVYELKKLGVHVDEALSLFRNEEHNLAQRLVNNNTQKWVQLPNPCFH